MSGSEFPSVYDMSMEELEERLLEIERNRIEFFDEARDGFYISTREGQLLDCNDALVKMLGYNTTEEVLSLDLRKDLWNNPEDRLVFRSIIEKRGFVRDYEATFKRKDGDIINVSLSSTLWRNTHGEIGGYRGLVVDKRQQKLMDHLLSISETRYKDLFNNIREGVFISDAAGKVMDCNRALCDIVGRTREEFQSMDYYRELFVDAHAVTDFRRKFTREGFVHDYELEIMLKDGTIRDVSMSGYATRNAAGEIVSYQGLMRDITDAKLMRKQLVLSERLSAMGKMASKLAHELNNPLDGIMNCLELLKDAVPETHEQKKYFDSVYSECARTSSRMIKMLKFFKPDEEQKRPTDINKLLEETLLFYDTEFKNLDIHVISEFAPLPMTMAVGNHLKQVFINMIINANAAMPDGGELRVVSRFDQGENSIMITIEDTGIGIPPQNLERIFEAFFTTKDEEHSIGLGLSICYALIEEHRGKISVASEVGKGTIFNIQLPVISPASEPEADE